MKSLPKYKSTHKKEVHHIERKSCEKYKLYCEDKIPLDRLFLNKKGYRYLNMIGKGGFGKVWKVEHLGTGQLFAMKEMSKAMLLFLYSVSSPREVSIAYSTKDSSSHSSGTDL